MSLRTCLWFDEGGEEAAAFYVTLLPGSRIDSIHRSAPDAPALVVNFTLQDVPYQILNGGPLFPLSPAVSIAVTTPDQVETDRLWDALLADGGAESRCGWLTDRWGLSWQIVPEALMRLMSSPDRAAAARVHEAMMGMVKLDVAALEAAAAGNGAG